MSLASRSVLLSVGLVTLLLLPGALRAQDVVVEEQLPIDSAGTLYEIDPDLRERLELFEEIEGYTGARLFRLEDGRTVLEISYRRDGRALRERRILEPEVVASLRTDLSGQIALMESEGAGSGMGLDREGRGRLILGQTALGLGFYGWAVAGVLDLEGARSRVATYLLTSGLSFLVPYFLTRDAPVRPAHGRMTWWGGSRGILYGLLAASVVTGDGEYGDDAPLTTAIGTSLVGSFLGYGVVEWEGLDEGESVLWSTTADIGTLTGLATGYAAGFYEEVLVERRIEDPVIGGPTTIVESGRRNIRAGHLTTLALTAGGLVAGRWLGDRDDYTIGDAYALRSAAALGAQVALPLAELVAADEDREEAYAGGAALGAVAGVAGGARLLEGRDVSSGEGLILNAGQLAGTLGAMGLTWLVFPDDVGNELIYSTAQVIGGAAGLALTWSALDPGGSAPSASRSGPSAGAGTTRRNSGGRERVRVQLAPTGLLAGLGLGASGRGAGVSVPPLVTILF